MFAFQAQDPWCPLSDICWLHTIISVLCVKHHSVCIAVGPEHTTWTRQYLPLHVSIRILAQPHWWWDSLQCCPPHCRLFRWKLLLPVCIHDTTSRSNWVWSQLWLLRNKQEADCRTVVEVKSSTWHARSMWYAVPSDTRRHQWFGAVCNVICLWWYQKQDFGWCEGCKMDSSEEEKHNPTCAWLGQSPSAPCLCKLSCIFAEALQATKSPLPISHGWHLVNGLCLPICSSQLPLPQSMQLPQLWTVLVKAVKVRTLILTNVVYTVDHVVIANRVTRVNKRCIRIV